MDSLVVDASGVGGWLELAPVVDLDGDPAILTVVLPSSVGMGMGFWSLHQNGSSSSREWKTSAWTAGFE